MSEAHERHAAFVAALRDGTSVPQPVIAAFERVPRHRFLPGVPLEVAYRDDAVVTHEENGVPTSSSSQPSLMARMLALLDVRPGMRVLEIGAGTGYNAALLAELGAAVTTIELQPRVAAAARAQLGPVAVAEPSDLRPGAVLVVVGDGASPPRGPYDRVIVTAGCWSLPAPLVDALADGGILVAPLRINAVELVFALRRDGHRLHGSRAVACGFMPLRGGAERPWRWELGGGGVATADADLGVEGRGALDRLLATPARAVDDPFALRDGEQPLDALLWLGLRGDPLLSLALPQSDRRPPWTVGLDVLPASLLVIELGAAYGTVGSARLYGGDAALRTCAEGIAGWRAAGSPGPADLAITIEPGAARAGWSLPFPGDDGKSTMFRGAHRWGLRYA